MWGSQILLFGLQDRSVLTEDDATWWENVQLYTLLYNPIPNIDKALCLFSKVYLITALLYHTSI